MSLESFRVVLIDSLNEGLVEPKHFRIEKLSIDATNLQDNEFILQVLSMSADPYLRGAIKSTGMIKPGDVMRGFVAGQVIYSKHPSWNVGDFLGSSLPFQTVQKISDNDLKVTITWKLTGLVTKETISYGVGVLGMPGATAYGGFFDVLAPKEGETIFISAASGAVGSLVGQLAKQIKKNIVIGSCGGQSKCDLIVKKFGFDAAIDYKTIENEQQLIKAIKDKTNGKGIDMYFENVGGIHFTASMETLRPFGRVAVCGGISDYNNAVPVPVPFYPLKMIYSAQKVEGFMCRPWLAGQKGNFLKDMHQWLTEGKIQIQETFFDGVDQWPLAFQSLFTGANVGKVVVRIQPAQLPQ